MTILSLYLALFSSAFLAATLIPAQSELGLAYLISQYDLPLVTLIAVASAGNILGAMVNWYLGKICIRFEHRRWFPLSQSRIARAQNWFQKFGKWSLLLSWVPIIGDPITLAAGLLRTPFWTSLALVTLAKVGRYGVVAMLTLAVI